MFPNNEFASEYLYTTLLPPRTIFKKPLISGARLTSTGAVRYCEYFPKTGDLVINSASEDISFVLWNLPGIVWLEFTYDQLDRVFVAYQIGDGPTCEVWIYWFDPVPSSYVHTKLADGAVRPVCMLDDRRLSQSGSTDILVGYQVRELEVDPLGNEVVLTNQVYYLIQRERFLTAHPCPPVPLEYMLTTCGMTEEWRFAFTGISELPDAAEVRAGPRQVTLDSEGKIAVIM